jgi:ferritin-like metal-binding protein YciE
MALETLRDLYLDHIQDLYSSEAQILDALPKMIDKATHVRLRDGFAQHLEQTPR